MLDSIYLSYDLKIILKLHSWSKNVKILSLHV